MSMESLRVEDAGWFGEHALSREGSTRFLVVARKMMAGLLRFLVRPRAANESVLRIEEKVSLGPKKMLFVVHCDGRRFLVATGAETVTSPIELLQEQPSPKSRVAGRSRGNTGTSKAGGESRR